MPALDVALACRGPGGSKLDPGALTSLDLRGKGVNAIAPSLGSQLTSLAKLDLADNVLGNDCVKELASLKTLKHLSLANNELEGDALRPWLAAGGGSVSSADAAALSGKKRKDAPQLHARRGKHSVNKKGERLTRVVDHGEPGGIFPSMRVLNVSGNGLVSVSGVAAARNLGALIANENKIQTLKHVDVLTNLNTIVASSNEIDELGEEFRDLVNLNKLSLSHNALETVGDALSKCKALRELRLAHNKIKTLPKNALADCVDLRVLDVSGNAFSDFGDVEALKHLPKLQQLSMRGSPLSRDNKAYDKTVAKMCPSLKTLDGRRVGPGGWLDADRRDADRVKNENRDLGDVRDRRDRSDRDPSEKNAWADARAAAGLDPLESAEKAEPSEPSDDATSGSDDDDDDEEEEMDDEEREMMAEVRALRASMRAEENAKREKTGDGKARKKVGRDDGDEDSEENPSTTIKKKTSSASIPGVSPAPGAEGTSFLQELVARNVGTVRESLGGGGEERRKTDDEKNAAATRSGVVKIVEVRSRNRRDGGDGKKKRVVATGREAFLALLGDGAETERDLGAWGGGGWGVEEDDAKSRNGTERREKKTKRADGSVDDDGDVHVSRPPSSSERKKKKKRVSVDAFDPEKKKRREDDPWNDEEARRRKKATLAKKKKLNVLARRYKKA
jgi:hypothetical protein